MSHHDWRNWQTCRCGEKGCLSSHPYPSADDLLGADPDWTGGLSVDEYMAEARRKDGDADAPCTDCGYPEGRQSDCRTCAGQPIPEEGDTDA